MSLRKSLLDTLESGIAEKRQSDTLAAAAEQVADRRRRLGDNPEHQAAAQLLGVPPREIRKVARSGIRRVIVIETTDGTSYAWVPADSGGDADGKTGLMLWRPRRGTPLILPVYAAQSTRPAMAAAPVLPPLDEIPDEPPWMDAEQQALLAQVAELEALAAKSGPGDDAHAGPVGQLRQLRQVVRARAARLEDAWATDHPEPPTAEDLAYYREAVDACSRIVASTDPTDRRRIFEQFQTRHQGRCHFIRTVDHLLDEHQNFVQKLDRLERQSAEASR